MEGIAVEHKKEKKSFIRDFANQIAGIIRWEGIEKGYVDVDSVEKDTIISDKISGGQTHVKIRQLVRFRDESAALNIEVLTYDDDREKVLEIVMQEVELELRKQIIWDSTLGLELLNAQIKIYQENGLLEDPKHLKKYRGLIKLRESAARKTNDPRMLKVLARSRDPSEMLIAAMNTATPENDLFNMMRKTTYMKGGETIRRAIERTLEAKNEGLGRKPQLGVSET